MPRHDFVVNHTEDPVAGFVRCECGYYVEPCSVPGCNRPRLAVAPTCYGHTVDESDPRYLPTAHIDGPEAHQHTMVTDDDGHQWCLNCDEQFDGLDGAGTLEP